MSIKSEVKILPVHQKPFLDKAKLPVKNPDRKDKFDSFSYLGESEMAAVAEIRRERQSYFY